MRYVILMLCFAGCGRPGETVPHWSGVTYTSETSDITPEMVSCAIDLVPTAISGDSRWIAAKVAVSMNEAPVGLYIRDVDGWYDSGRSGLNIEWEYDNGELELARHMHGLAHGLRHLVAFRLTGNGQATHVDPETGPWTDQFESRFRRALYESCHELP